MYIYQYIFTMEVTSQEEDYFLKLELLKDIRQKTILAEKMKLAMKEMMNDLKNEDKCLQEYQTETDLLIQEKMAHVEELRLIHTDINTMENLTKQVKTSRQKLVDEIKKTYKDFLPLQTELNEMRQQGGIKEMKESEILAEIPQLQESDVAEAKNQTVERECLSVSVGATSDTLSGKLGLGKPSIRQQQPPPMKSCQSCHQLIHRNAPICPLCKAKSRSRNPKKLKRKQDY